MALLQITEQLADRGHNITLGLEDWEVSTFKTKGVLQHKNYNLIINKAYDSPEEGQRQFIAIRDTMASLGNNPIAALKFVLGVQASLCKQFIHNVDTAKKLDEMEVDLVVADFSHPCAIVIADMKKVPYVIFSPTSLGEPLFSAMVGVNVPPSTFPVHGTGMTVDMSYAQRLVNFAAYQFMARVLAPAMIHNDLRKELGIPVRKNLGDARLFLLNEDFAVEFPVSLPPLFKEVGPLLAKTASPLNQDVKKLLGEQSGGAIYVSFGSAFVLDKPEEVRTLAHALSTLAATKGFNIVWRITKDELPENMTLGSLNLHENVHPVDWVPQNDILGSSKLGAFIHHGGTNSVYESAYHGVPCISIPFANDHMDHAAKAAYRGFGITVSRKTLTDGDPEPLIAAVESLTANGADYKQRAEAVGKMLRGHRRSGAERGADWIEYALSMPEDNSGDLRGVSGELSWAALHSIDVLIGWIGIVGVILGVVLLLLRLVYKLIKGIFVKAVKLKVS